MMNVIQWKEGRMGVWSQPPGGFTTEQRRQRRRRARTELSVLALAVVSAASIGGYGWVTTVNPVDRSQAIDLFRDGRSELPGGSAESIRDRPKQEQPAPGGDEAGTSDPSPLRQPRVPRRSVASAEVEQPDRPRRPQRTAAKPSEEQQVAAPEEGVYSWDTEGYEQVGATRRDFPAETQRIITAGHGRTWNQHHYFSEERQIWTAFQPSSTGVEVTQQRNKVTFGPVTRGSQIDFNPPMLVAPRSLRVGSEWHGEWTGDTYGSYSSKVFEHTTMTIGGEAIEVWGMTYVINLRGEQKGQVNAQVWFAPGPGLTVKEHYVQDVESSGARYHAEWMQTLKSLQPSQ